MDDEHGHRKGTQQWFRVVSVPPRWALAAVIFRRECFARIVGGDIAHPVDRMAIIHLLGAATAAERSTDTRGRLAPPRRLALIALLAIGRAYGVHRDEIVALLWPRETSTRGSESLAALLDELRAEFGDDALFERADRLQLNTDRVMTDVVQFESAADGHALEDAAAAYNGEFLEGFFLDGAAEFEQWASDQRIRLARRAAEAFDHLADAARDRGDHVKLANWLRRRVELEPYEPAPTLRLMRALESAGDAHAALRVGRTYESRIRTFLETDPAPEVLAETRRLRAIVGPLATPSGGTPNAAKEP